MSDSSNPASGAARRRRRGLEIYAATLLGLASIVAAWSSYQAARWGGEQSTQYSRASAMRVESTRASAGADALKAIDIATFSAWIDAYATGAADLQNFYEERMRPEFRPAFEAWVEAQRSGDPIAPTPFQLDSYHLALTIEAAEMAEQAETTFASGQVANERSDAYVLNVVFLATVLFLAGIAQQFDWVRLQMVLLGVGTLLLAVGVYNIIALPML